MVFGLPSVLMRSEEGRPWQRAAPFDASFHWGLGVGPAGQLPLLPAIAVADFSTESSLVGLNQSVFAPAALRMKFLGGTGLRFLWLGFGDRHIRP